jgi:Mor family transcriptional regulator
MKAKDRRERDFNIRKDFLLNKFTVKQLVEKYKLSQAQIYNILTKYPRG